MNKAERAASGAGRSGTFSVDFWMPPDRLLLVAVLGEGVLVVVALGWAAARGLSIECGPVGVGLVAGLVGATAFALANLYLLRRAPSVVWVRSIRRLHHTVLKPLFGDVGLHHVIVISVAAGVGEELLFRGVVQPEIGLVPASLLFGALHLGGSGTFAFGCWAALLGLALGWLAMGTGGLLAPIVTHAVYDGMAIAYIRWADERPDHEPAA